VPTRSVGDDVVNVSSNSTAGANRTYAASRRPSAPDDTARPPRRRDAVGDATADRHEPSSGARHHRVLPLAANGLMSSALAHPMVRTWWAPWEGWGSRTGVGPPRSRQPVVRQWRCLVSRNVGATSAGYGRGEEIAGSLAPTRSRSQPTRNGSARRWRFCSPDVVRLALSGESARALVV
jgi:hypothetical protein